MTIEFDTGFGVIWLLRWHSEPDGYSWELVGSR